VFGVQVSELDPQLDEGDSVALMDSDLPDHSNALVDKSTSVQVEHATTPQQHGSSKSITVGVHVVG